MRAARFLFWLPILAGCASHVYHDRAVSHPRYHEGTFYPTFSSERSDRDGNNTGDAVLGVVEAAISLVRNPQFYRKSTVGGRCVCQVAGPGTLDVPCGNVTVILRDARGRELERAAAVGGEFAFAVEPNRTHFLSVASHHYRLPLDRVGPVSMGDDVVLRLVPLRAAHDSGGAKRPN